MLITQRDFATLALKLFKNVVRFIRTLLVRNKIPSVVEVEVPSRFPTALDDEPLPNRFGRHDRFTSSLHWRYPTAATIFPDPALLTHVWQ